MSQRSTSCEQIQIDAAGIAALAADDDERVAAFAHARACRACADALAEGARVVALLDALPAPAAPAADVLARVRAEIRAELEADQAARAAPSAAVVAPAAVRTPARPASSTYWPEAALAAGSTVVVAVAFLTALLEWYHRPVAASVWVEAAVLVGLAATAAAVALLRRTPWVPLAVIGASVAFALWRGHSHPIVRAQDCAVLELIAAGVSLAPTLLLVLTRRLRGGVATLAGMSAAGAMAGQAALDVVCVGAGRLQHLLAVHTAGIVVAALAGALLALVPGLRAPRAGAAPRPA